MWIDLLTRSLDRSRGQKVTETGGFRKSGIPETLMWLKQKKLSKYMVLHLGKLYSALPYASCQDQNTWQSIILFRKANMGRRIGRHGCSEIALQTCADNWPYFINSILIFQKLHM